MLAAPNLIDQLDWVRAQLLVRSMRWPLLRAVFVRRAHRLAVWFGLAFFVHLIVSLVLPLWALLIGPLVLGVPHLLASIRYIPREVGLKQNIFSLAGALFFLSLAALRLYFDNDHIEIAASLLIAGILITLVQAGRLATSLSLTGFVLLSLATFAFPLQTAGALILGHNFVGFAYWILRAPSSRERYVAIVATTLLLVFTSMIFAGIFDSAIHSHGPLRATDIGMSMIPRGSMQLWRRAVAAYALGQGLHYFVWLKALPELEIPHERAVNFRATLRSLRKDLGVAIPTVAGLLLLALFGYGFTQSWSSARDLYLSCATFHTYFELAGLAFVRPSVG